MKYSIADSTGNLTYFLLNEKGKILYPFSDSLKKRKSLLCAMRYFSTKESINKVVVEVRMAVRTRLFMENISTRNNNYTMTRWDPYCADDLKLPTRRNNKIFNNENKTSRCKNS